MLLYALLHSRKRIFVTVTGDVKWLRGNESRPRLERWKYRRILRRVSGVVTHTRFEARLMGGLVAAGERSRVRIVPFHQIGEHRWVRPSGQGHGRISFMGSGRRDKGLDRFVEMIVHDTTGKHEYGLYGDLHLDACTRAILGKAPANVEVVDRYISDSEYWERMRESSFVILPHRRSFEGALSGIFCDAIASGTPVIASRMEPYIEFFERFGEMGHLVDCEQPGWYRDILKRDLWEKYELFQSNMRRAREWHSHDRIRARLAEILFGERAASPESR
jgi:glycosyltransferase involved in cell wall biosynthesis